MIRIEVEPRELGAGVVDPPLVLEELELETVDCVLGAVDVVAVVELLVKLELDAFVVADVVED